LSRAAVETRKCSAIVISAVTFVIDQKVEDWSFPL
jgi:hypothetical protein